MKVKVTRRFRDRHTGTLYHKGDVLEVTEERYNEIARAGNFVYRLTESPAETLEDKGEEIPFSELENATESRVDALEAMSLRELREYANVAHKMTFKVGVKKAEIIEVLRRMENNGK